MNTELIHITTSTINGEEVRTVNARKLHAFLGVKRDYSTWIKDRIAQYGFVEGQDYLLTKIGEQVVFPKMGENLKGGRPTIEHHLTLDTAKEISMVERNEKGKEARRYFIACEKQAKAAITGATAVAEIAAPALSALLPEKYLQEAMGRAMMDRLDAWVKPLPYAERADPKMRLYELLAGAFGFNCNYTITKDQFENCMRVIPLLDVNGFREDIFNTAAGSNLGSCVSLLTSTAQTMRQQGVKPKRISKPKPQALLRYTPQRNEPIPTVPSLRMFDGLNTESQTFTINNFQQNYAAEIVARPYWHNNGFKDQKRWHMSGWMRFGGRTTSMLCFFTKEPTLESVDEHVRLCRQRDAG